MAHCNRPDCGRGRIDDQGFCTDCGRRPLPAAAGRSAAAEPRRQARATGAGVGVRTVPPDPWYGLELADALGPATVEDGQEPVPELSKDPLEEHRRVCGNPRCGRPVGRSRGGLPGVAAGNCMACGHPYDHTARVGEVVAGRYEIRGRLGFGTGGTAFLAHDRNLGTEVVLKTLTESSVQATADRERDALAGLRHDSIVRIMGYESEGHHLVLEYVPGSELSKGGDRRLAVLLAHGLRILQALDYLHGRGLLHCDVKPSNIVRFAAERVHVTRDGQDRHERRERVRLIDFGSVRRRDEVGEVKSCTEKFAPPPTDPEYLQPDIGFDLFSVGKTLQQLCLPHLSDQSAPGVGSLTLLLKRATDVAEPAKRFATARQFGEQLSGVIRQVVAGPPREHQVIRASALFGRMLGPLHGGLGEARPLGHWVDATLDDTRRLLLPPPCAVPTAREIALALPAPLRLPDDPEAPEGTARALARARRALGADDPEAAADALRAAALPHWLRDWYAGLVALLRAGKGPAAREFTKVRGTLPGELIPQLALGLCAEGDPRDPEDQRRTALAHYTTVFETTPAIEAAAFGLARMQLLAGRRTFAAGCLDRLIKGFQDSRAVRVAAVRLLVAESRSAGDVPGEAQVAAADTGLARLRAEIDQVTFDSLHAEIRHAEFLRTRDPGPLFEALRTLADNTTSEHRRHQLLDVAHSLLPPVTWRPWAGRR